MIEPTPKTPALCCATALRKASRRLTQLYDEALAPTGLRSTQLTVLAELAARPANPPTLSELADSLVLDRSALGHNLRPLERDGLIEIRESAKDRRQRHIILTTAGKRIYKDAVKHWKIAQAKFVSLYGERETTRLRATLTAIAYDKRLGQLKDEQGS
jgi:DNA-binding MarR family transcriptional regulator